MPSFSFHVRHPSGSDTGMTVRPTTPLAMIYKGYADRYGVSPSSLLLFYSNELVPRYGVVVSAGLSHGCVVNAIFI